MVNQSGSLTASQLVSSGRQPRLAGSRYTMPQRLTVAGEATARSPTSKIIDMVADMAMISLLGRQSFLLSSSTVLRFSIQMASTGPSSTSHLRSGEGSAARFLKATASAPSRHSWVALSDSPAGQGSNHWKLVVLQLQLQSYKPLCHCCLQVAQGCQAAAQCGASLSHPDPARLCT